MNRWYRFKLVAVLVGLLFAGGAATATADELKIEKAEWSGERQRLDIKVKAKKGQTVKVENAYDAGQVLAFKELREDELTLRLYMPGQIPCRIKVTNETTGLVKERDVEDKETERQPASCAPTDPTDPPAENKPPVAKAGPDQTLTPAAGQASVAVALDGSGSSDSDGSIALYDWSGSPTPSDVAKPTVTLGVGTHNFSLKVTDDKGAMSGTDSVTITVNSAPAVNQPPVANAGLDQTLTLGFGETQIAVMLDGNDSTDPDGTVAGYVWTGSPDPEDIATPVINLGVGSHLFTLQVTDNQSADSGFDTVQITVNPFPTTAEEAHATILVYEGPSTCVACHNDEAVDMHGSVHYQQTGPTDFVTNIVSTPENPDALAGKRGNGEIGINTYCGTPENSPRFTCAGCHVGNGRFPMAQSEFELLDPASDEAHTQLANIDCLTCHQDLYKRFPEGPFESLFLVPEGTDGLPDNSVPMVELKGPSGVPVVDPVSLDFLFEPADGESMVPSMTISRHEAARTVHKTTRQTCLSCHAGAGGGDGVKRGDMSSALVDPDLHTDMHMSAAGESLTCSDCHNKTLPDGTTHRVRGRGLDLRPNDVAERFTCESCHDQPHGDYSNVIGDSRDKHATRVSCQTCHIPTYAKVVPTEVSRDWTHPHFSAAACNGRGGWLPEEIKAGDLIPTYAWFDGTSEVYFKGEPLDDVPQVILDDGSQAYVLGQPNGEVNTADAKIYPMKEHLSVAGRHLASNALIAHSTFDFFRTGSFATAVESGLEQEGRAGDSYDLVQTHTYQTINHGVEEAGNALECGACHSSLAGGPVRMDLEADMGYSPKPGVCNDCHETKSSKGFVDNHKKHVESKRYDCALCHTFSRPERGLKTSK